MKLYGYWRSTSSYRLRIALALKGVRPEQVAVHLVRGGGEQNGPAYRRINLQGRVPSLMLDDGEVLLQSPAIIEYLEETIENPPLLPSDPVARAKVRGIAAIIGCDTHPLHNAAALNMLRSDLGVGEVGVKAWISRWIGDGLTAAEALLGDQAWAYGTKPGLADIYLVPQVYAARRFQVQLDHCPRIMRIEALANDHPAFKAAHPANQPDAE